jgi:MFS family permease
MSDRLWDRPGFRPYMAGRVVSELGSRVTREGLPVVAILATGASTVDLGVLAALSSLAAVSLAPWAGILVDRTRRRPVMIASDLLRALALVSVPAAALAHRHIAVVTAVVGGLTVVYDVADQAWLPGFVSRRHLVAGNAAVAAASAVGETGGPVLMGPLVQWLGGPMAILCDAVSYLVSAVSLLLIRHPEPGGQRPADAAGSARRAVAALRAVLVHPLLRPLVLTLATQSLFWRLLRRPVRALCAARPGPEPLRPRDAHHGRRGRRHGRQRAGAARLPLPWPGAHPARLVGALRPVGVAGAAGRRSLPDDLRRLVPGPGPR